MRVDDVAEIFCWSLEMGLKYAEDFEEDGTILLAKVLVGGADPTGVYEPSDRLLREYPLTIASCPVPSDCLLVGYPALHRIHGQEPRHEKCTQGTRSTKRLRLPRGRRILVGGDLLTP